MIDANNLINNLRAKAYKKGYTFEELPEAKKISIFLSDYNLPNNNLLTQLETLTLQKVETSDFTAAGYRAKTNTITYTDKKRFYHELFHMASTKKGSNTTGITINEIINGEQVKLNTGLDEGITDMFAEMVDFNTPCGYPLEKISAEMLRNVFGMQIFIGYLENSYDDFIDSFPYEVQEYIEDLIANLDEYKKIIFANYSEDSSYNSSESLEDIVKYIIRNLYDIALNMGRKKNEIINFLKEKACDPKLNAIRQRIQIDQAIENLTTKSL